MSHRIARTCDAELDRNFAANTRFGGWGERRSEDARVPIGVLPGSEDAVELGSLRG